MENGTRKGATRYDWRDAVLVGVLQGDYQPHRPATLCDRAVIAQKLFDRYQGTNDYEAGARIACNHIILEEMEGLDVAF